jgi:hypothetical protein
MPEQLSGLPQIVLCGQFVGFASLSTTGTSGNSERRDGAIGGNNRARKAVELRQRPRLYQNRCRGLRPGGKQDRESSSPSEKGKNGQRRFIATSLTLILAARPGHGLQPLTFSSIHSI